MRLANLKQDFWELRSAEESNRLHPDTFPIPTLESRRNLQRGQAAKLIFDIESIDEDENIQIQGERIWVIVAESRDDGFYIGILDSPPASIVTGEKSYLCFGAEIPFTHEHIIEIAQPPQEYVDWQLSQPPERRWQRE